MSAPPPRPGASGATPPPRPIAGSAGGHPQAVGRLAPSRPTQSIRSRSAQATNAPITRRWFLWGGLAAVALLIGGVVGFAIGSSGASPAGAPTLSPTTPPTKTPISSSQPSVTPLPSAEPSQEPVDAVDRARRALDDVPVVDGRSDTRYFRDAFGEAWYDVDGNGCRTRDDILGRDLADPVFKPGTNDCRVLSGVLTDPYSGVVRDFVFGYETSQLVPVDHVVALAWAWHHGAEAWTPERRVQFANDPINLVATTKEMNEEKLAHGPSEWLPPLESGRCEYIVHWVDVLDAYDLGVNVADKATAERVLKDC